MRDALATITDFLVNATVTAGARERAAVAFRDTMGVMLAGSREPAARVAQSMAAEDGVGACRVVGTALTTSADFSNPAPVAPQNTW